MGALGGAGGYWLANKIIHDDIIRGRGEKVEHCDAGIACLGIAVEHVRRGPLPHLEATEPAEIAREGRLESRATEEMHNDDRDCLRRVQIQEALQYEEGMDYIAIMGCNAAAHLRQG